MSTIAANQADCGALLPIAVGTLIASAMLTFDLYLPGERPGGAVLYRRRSYPLAQADLDDLRARGIRTLYIPSGDADGYRTLLRDTVLKNEDLAPLARYETLREATRAVLSNALAKGDAASAVQITLNVSAELVRTVCDSQLIMRELLKTMSHDYSNFTHAMNTSTYCLLLAQRLGISDQQELLRIGQGALLHDIGMQYVPRRILDKPGKLTARERMVIQQHTIRGFRELCHRDDLTAGQLQMVYGHHERCDGGGYPVGLPRSEIHPHARLCAIADVHAAMTQDRPHRPAIRQAYVVEYLDRQAGRAFDEEMTRCWLSVIAPKI